MKCCTNCFNDNFLIEFIQAHGSMSNCDFCYSKSVACIEPVHFRRQIEGLIDSCFIEHPQGTGAGDLLQKSFHFFSDKMKYPENFMRNALKEETLEKKYIAAVNPEENISSWHDFKEEIKHINRYFPCSSFVSKLVNNQTEQNSVFLTTLEQLAYSLSPELKLFRARISDAILSDKDMGPPPPELATSGRANPQGIPYLYLTNDEDLALSEVRPTIGHEVYISEVSARKELKLLDLTCPKKSSSPFLFSDEQVPIFMEQIQILENFSNDLKKPINPTRAAFDYIPTQFICEYIKSVSSFSGILFNSAFGGGENFVLFDISHIEIKEPKRINITGTKHEKEEIHKKD